MGESVRHPGGGSVLGDHLPSGGSVLGYHNNKFLVFLGTSVFPPRLNFKSPISKVPQLLVNQAFLINDFYDPVNLLS